ncbi:ParB family protein [Xenorhabdus sp. SGI246]|uniref:ParB family protein n=1 Tax=Xenorhabdus sp. SGI246 TaxID=3158263 RepID=UPI00349F60A4
MIVEHTETMEFGVIDTRQMFNNEDGSYIFTLSSGKTAIFYKTIIYNQYIEESTFVDCQINGREQITLTEKSLNDILRTIKIQQFFPAIGYKINDRIAILDGSRRRAAALIAKANLEILVTESQISQEDARQLAMDIQTAKEHSIREIGIRLIALRNSGMNNKEIAKLEKLSHSKVTRAIQAASVPVEMIEVFPVAFELTHKDYKMLLDASILANDKDINISCLVDEVKKEAKNIAQDIPTDDYKNKIIQLFRKNVMKLKKETQILHVTVENLYDFDDKRTYARKRTNTKNRTFSYEFSKISKNIQIKLDEIIQTLITQELGKNNSLQ